MGRDPVEIDVGGRGRGGQGHDGPVFAVGGGGELDLEVIGRVLRDGVAGGLQSQGSRA